MVFKTLGMRSILTLMLLFNILLVFSQEKINAKIVSSALDNFIDIRGVAQNNETVIKDDFS